MSSYASRSRRMMMVLARLAVAAAVLPGCSKKDALFPTKQELPGLVKKLKDPDPKVRQDTLDRIRYLQADAAEALPQLLEVWEDEDRTCRMWAADAVGLMGDAAYPDVKKRLTGESARQRALAWHAVVCFPAEVKLARVAEINPLFAKGIQDEDDAVRHEAAYAFMTFNSVARDASTSVIEALKANKDKWMSNSSDSRIIRYIVAGFQYYEKEHLELARPLVPVLKELMNSNDSQIRGVSTGLLVQLGEIKLDDSNADPSKAPSGPRAPPKPRGD